MLRKLPRLVPTINCQPSTINRLLFFFSFLLITYYLLLITSFSVFAQEKPSFIKVKDLKVGDVLFQLEQPVPSPQSPVPSFLKKEKIIEKTWIDEPIDVYNLTVGGDRTFFANGLAVHNKNEQPKAYFYWDIDMDGCHDDTSSPPDDYCDNDIDEPTITPDPDGARNTLISLGKPAEEIASMVAGSAYATFQVQDMSEDDRHILNNESCMNSGYLQTIHGEWTYGSCGDNTQQSVPWTFGQTGRNSEDPTQPSEWRVGGLNFKDHDPVAPRPGWSWEHSKWRWSDFKGEKDYGGAERSGFGLCGQGDGWRATQVAEFTADYSGTYYFKLLASNGLTDVTRGGVFIKNPGDNPSANNPNNYGITGNKVCDVSADIGYCTLQTGQDYVLVYDATCDYSYCCCDAANDCPGYCCFGGHLFGEKRSDMLRTDIPSGGPEPIAAIPLVKEASMGTIEGRIWDEGNVWDGTDGDTCWYNGALGDSVVSQTVHIDSTTGGQTYQISSDSEGNYFSKDVLSDTYKVWIELGSGYSTTEECRGVVNFDCETGECWRIVTVVEGATEWTPFSLVMEEGIQGRVWKDKGGESCYYDDAADEGVGLTVTAVSGTDSYTTSSSSTNGSFSLSVPIGTYTVSAPAPVDHYASSTCQGTLGFTCSKNACSKVVTVSSGSGASGINFPFWPYGSITGQVFKTTGDSCDTSTPISESGWEITCNTIPVRHDSVSQFTCVDSSGSEDLEVQTGYGLQLMDLPVGLSGSCWPDGATFNLTRASPTATARVVLAESTGAWFQVTGGDVHADGSGVTDPIPAACIGDPECEPYFFNLSGSSLTWHSTLDSETAVTSPEVGSGGTIGGGATFVSGQYGNGVLVNSSGEYVSFPTDGNFDPQKGVIEFWYKKTGTPADYGKFFCSDDTLDGNMQLYRHNSDKEIHFQVRDSSTNYDNKWLNTNVDLFDEEWHHVKFSYDADTDNAELWLDFEKETRDITAAFPSVTLQANLYIGNRVNDQNREIGGIIDEFKVYGESSSVVSDQLGVLSRASGSVSLGDVVYPENLSEYGQPKWRALSGSFDGVRADYHFYHRQLEREIEDWDGSPEEGVWETTTTTDLVIGGAGWGGLTDKVVLLHDGNVLVDGEITVASGGSLVVIASGKISISSDIEEVHGIYIAESIETGNGYEKLDFEGSLIGWGSVSLQRDLDSDPGGRQNYNTPAEIITYRPDIVINAHSSLKQPSYRWEEVSP